jgi:IS605 OrfB family transposase
MTETFTVLCVTRNVKEVVVGDLGGIKKEKDGTGKNWNDKANQNWQQFPIRTLVTQLDYKLARFGIKVIEQDEKGTSKGRCSKCGCMNRSNYIVSIVVAAVWAGSMSVVNRLQRNKMR